MLPEELKFFAVMIAMYGCLGTVKLRGSGSGTIVSSPSVQNPYIRANIKEFLICCNEYCKFLPGLAYGAPDADAIMEQFMQGYGYGRGIHNFAKKAKNGFWNLNDPPPHTGVFAGYKQWLDKLNYDWPAL